MIERIFGDNRVDGIGVKNEYYVVVRSFLKKVLYI